MSEYYFPFPSGSGELVSDKLFSLMGRGWIPSGVFKGVLNELAVSADGTSMQVSLDTGAGSVLGPWYYNDAVKQIPIAAADATNPRIDVIALRTDWAANTVSVVVLTGTPAANPAAPALTQNDILTGGTRWEIALAQVSVAAGATIINAGDVTDKRSYTGYSHTSDGIYDSVGFSPSGLTGVTAASRYVGATASGAPTSGTFAVGDFVIDQTGVIWICTSAGNPGTWSKLPNLSSFSSSLAPNGYQKLPNGFILQWGWQTGLAASSTRAWTFPVQFPNQCFYANAQIYNSGSTLVKINYNQGPNNHLANAQFLFDGSTNADTYYYAIGY